MIEDLKQEYLERVAKKREELEHAVDDGLVADPFSATFLVSLAVSAAISTASYLVSRAFAPKPPRLEQGKLSGSLQLQNSEQGIFIPEIYGAGPSASLVAGANPTYQNLANVTGGANGSITKTSGGTNWNAGASHNVALTSGDEAFFQFTLGTGYATAGFTLDSSPTSGNADFLFAIQWNPDSSITIKYNSTQLLGNVTHWSVGDVFRLELRGGRFRLYKGSAEIFPQGMIVPSPSYPLYMGIAMQIVGAGISAAKVQINSIGDSPNAGRGGVKVPAIITWTSGIRKTVTTTQQPTGGGKGGRPSQTVENTVYDIDLAVMYANRGPYNLIREYANADILIDQFTQSANPTGVYDPTVGPDPDYSPTSPPDPSLNYLTPIQRVDAAIAVDGDGVGTGSIQGGSSSFAVYPGNDDQQPDPIIEADIDGKYGAGSTPAYKNRFYIRRSQYNLSRWGGIVPNHQAVLEHQTLVTLDDIYGSFCDRVGVLDHDLSGLSTIQSRGLLIAGRPFAPAEVMDSPEIKLAYNYFVTEAEGEIVGYVEGAEPSVTIPDTEIGWLDGDEDLPDIAPEVESILVSEISLPREVHVKSIDPDQDWDLNTALASRQITDGETVELLEVQICQLSDERRATAQRALYQRYVAGTAHKFTLSWKYLYLFAGYKIIVTRAEGFTHAMRLTSISGGVGVLDCEGIALEPETFNQPANGVFPPGYIPPQPIPAMIVMTMLDIPLFREADEGKLGYYAGGTPRTGVNQTFHGWTLHSQRNSVWSLRASSNLPATIGAVVSATALSNDPTVFDNVGTITVDLYGSNMTLSSVTEADVLAGMNLAVVQNFLLGFKTATQVAGFPNRWTLSGLLNGLHGTSHLVAGVLTGARFALLDNAVVFVPTTIDELNLLLTYRGVANGQSLGDAASFDFAWAGNLLLPPRLPSSFIGNFDTITGDLLMEWSGTSYPANPDQESYDLEIRNNANTATLRSLVVTPNKVRDQSEPVLWEVVADSDGKFTFLADGGIDIDPLTGGSTSTARSITEASIAGGLLVEFQIPPEGKIPPRFFALYPEDEISASFDYALTWVCTYYIADDTFYVQPEIFDTSATLKFPIIGGDRLSILIRPDGIAEYYINYLGQSSNPVYVSAKLTKPDTLYRIDVIQPPLADAHTEGVGLLNARWVRRGPEWRYFAGAQQQDFGLTPPSLPANVKARVRQRSPYVETVVTDWVSGVFTR